MPTCKLYWKCPLHRTALHIFYNTIETHIRGLSSLGKSEHSYGDLLIPIIMGKLTTEIQTNLAREHSNSPWNLPDLMAAILKEIQILECRQYDTQKSVLKSTAANFLVNSKDHHSKQQQGGSGSRKKQCVYCKGAHSAYNCDRVTDYQKRLNIIKGSNLCFNCLANHRVSQCPSKFHCMQCKKKHHTSLYNNSTSHNKSETPHSDNKAAGSATPTTTTGTPNTSFML